MKASFTAPQKEVHLQAYRKENNFYKQISLFSGRKEVVTVRFYSTGATVSCCVWVNSPHDGFPGEYPTQHPCGGGKCSTYGLDRESMAFENACNMAGYTFSEPVGGRGMQGGDQGMKALLAIAEGLGFNDLWVHKANA